MLLKVNRTKYPKSPRQMIQDVKRQRSRVWLCHRKVALTSRNLRHQFAQRDRSLQTNNKSRAIRFSRAFTLTGDLWISQYFRHAGYEVAGPVKEIQGQDALVTWKPITRLRHLPPPTEVKKVAVIAFITQLLDCHDSMSGRPSKRHRRGYGERHSVVAINGKT